MATKTTKKTTVTSTVTSSQTPYSGGSARPQSPLSPTRISRLQEKEDLQNLNDRLAVYIDKVRNLELENSRLNVQVQTTQETITREVTTIKSMYENELADARKLLDETAKDKAKLQIECTKFRQEAEELGAKLAKKEKDLDKAEKTIIYNENKIQELQSRTNQAVADRKRFEDEMKELRAENDKLNKQVNLLRKQLEDETLARVDLQNRAQSLKEELSFKEQVHEQQLTETQLRKQVEITKIDDHLQEQYERKLSDALRELREQYETQMRINREEVETLYETKMNDVRKLSEMNFGQAAAAREELRQSRTRIDTLMAKIEDLEKDNLALNSRISNLERQLDDERNAHLAVLASKNEELRHLQELLAQQFREYQDLMDIKVALDLEIAAYRKLLEGEEARLHISAVQSPRDSTRGTPVRRTPVGGRGVKRKRMMLMEDSAMSNFVSSATAKGEIEISEQDTDGKFVKVHNKGEKDTVIGGWQLIRKSGETEITYKFHRSINLKAGQTTTVWSSDTEVTHNPPSDLVMKNQKWVVGENFTTKLMNNNGEEMATRETIKQITSASHLRSSEGGYFEDGVDEGEPENPERCTIM